MTEQLNVSKDPDNREVVPIIQNIKVTYAIASSFKLANRVCCANSLIASHRLRPPENLPCIPAEKGHIGGFMFCWQETLCRKVVCLNHGAGNVFDHEIPPEYNLYSPVS